MRAYSELARALRHAVAPLVILAVERGWIPAAAQNDAIELGVIVATFAIVYGVSWWRDRQKEL
jgi:hypothetical protein